MAHDLQREQLKKQHHEHHNAHNEHENKGATLDHPIGAAHRFVFSVVLRSGKSHGKTSK